MPLVENDLTGDNKKTKISVHFAPCSSAYKKNKLMPLVRPLSTGPEIKNKINIQTIDSCERNT
jgi:hypothetical protein